jgi:hypothetical protein
MKIYRKLQKYIHNNKLFKNIDFIIYKKARCLKFSNDQNCQNYLKNFAA